MRPWSYDILLYLCWEFSHIWCCVFKKIHTKAPYMQKVLVWVHLRLYMPVLLPQASISPPQKSTFFSVVPSWIQVLTVLYSVHIITTPPSLPTHPHLPAPFILLYFQINPAVATHFPFLSNLIFVQIDRWNKDLFIPCSSKALQSTVKYLVQ